MFQALKICHEGNCQAIALLIDENLEGYHIGDAKGASCSNFSNSDGSNPEISTLPSKKFKGFTDAAPNPESHFPPNVPRGPYKYNPAMCELNVFGGEPVVTPDDVAGSLDTIVIFGLEKMTQTKLRKIRSELFKGVTDE